jgi:hypothetical protein
MEHTEAMRRARLGRDRASGVDGVTWREYGEHLGENLRDLVARTKAKRYKPHCRPSSGWGRSKDAKTVWMADLPAEAFVGYNPFLARNLHEEFVILRHDSTTSPLRRQEKRVYSGRW